MYPFVESYIHFCGKLRNYLKHQQFEWKCKFLFSYISKSIIKLKIFSIRFKIFQNFTYLILILNKCYQKDGRPLKNTVMLQNVCFVFDFVYITIISIFKTELMHHTKNMPNLNASLVLSRL